MDSSSGELGYIDGLNKIENNGIVRPVFLIIGLPSHQVHSMQRRGDLDGHTLNHRIHWDWFRPHFFTLVTRHLLSFGTISDRDVT